MSQELNLDAMTLLLDIAPDNYGDCLRNAAKLNAALRSTIARIRELERAQPAGEAVALHAAVEAMVSMLEEGEWAEHVASTTGKGDPLAQRLEVAITNLINGADDGE